MADTLTNSEREEAFFTGSMLARSLGLGLDEVLAENKIVVEEGIVPSFGSIKGAVGMIKHMDGNPVFWVSWVFGKEDRAWAIAMLLGYYLAALPPTWRGIMGFTADDIFRNRRHSCQTTGATGTT